MKPNLTHIILVILVSFSVPSCSGRKIITVKPVGNNPVKSVTIENGNLKTVFIDNTDLPPNHKAGYNGIAELYYKDQDSNVFVPSYEGFNLEHIFSKRQK